MVSSQPLHHRRRPTQGFTGREVTQLPPDQSHICTPVWLFMVSDRPCRGTGRAACQRRDRRRESQGCATPPSTGISAAAARRRSGLVKGPPLLESGVSEWRESLCPGRDPGRSAPTCPAVWTDPARCVGAIGRVCEVHHGFDLSVVNAPAVQGRVDVPGNLVARRTRPEVIAD